MRLFRVVIVSLFTGIALFAVCLAVAWKFVSLAAGNGSPASSLFSTADTISAWFGLLGLMVALASVILTVLGLVVGALALFGFQTFKDQVTRSVGEAAILEMNRYFGGPGFETKLENKVKEHVSAQSWTSGTATSPSSSGLKIRAYPAKKKGVKSNDPPLAND